MVSRKLGAMEVFILIRTIIESISLLIQKTFVMIFSCYAKKYRE